MRKHFHRMLGSLALLAASLTGGTWIYTQHPKFGKLPDGARLDKIKRSPSYYTAEDMPEIDYLLITHDHWDHLDYSTVTALRARTKTGSPPE